MTVDTLPALVRQAAAVHAGRPAILDGTAPAGALDWRAFLDGGNAVAVADAEARARGVMADDISDLIFTAGTTGQSKGVACTHGQTLRVFRTWSEIVGLHPRDRYL